MKRTSESSERGSPFSASGELETLNHVPTLLTDSGSFSRFGRFSVYPGARVVLCDGRPVDIGSRAFDLLVLLLSSRGNLVTKEEIIRYVWPHTVVAESNIRYQMASLRRVLGRDSRSIKTVPGRGYIFSAEVVESYSQRNSPVDELSSMPMSSPLDRVATASAGISTESYHQIPSLAVAIIDDDSGIRDAILSFLRSAGLSVESFSSVKAFRDRPRAMRLGCIILDVLLPGQSGLEFQADLVRAGESVPLIFISGYADVPMSVRAMKAGAFNFFTKPVRHHELLDAVSSAVALSASTLLCGTAEMPEIR